MAVLFRVMRSRPEPGGQRGGVDRPNEQPLIEKRTGVARTTVRSLHERLFDVNPEANICCTNGCLTCSTNACTLPPMAEQLTARQRGILDMIETSMRERGYPPSVREIGEAVGLTSPSTVHSHLASLQRLGYLKRDPTKPRAIEVRFDPSSGAAIERRPVRHVPLVGDVAAGTDVLAQENVEELFPLPEDFTGDGDLFMLRVRGDSMIEIGIMDGDFVVARAQETANNGDVVIAGIPGEEATVKTYQRKGASVSLIPANPRLSPMVFAADQVQIFGRVVTVMRRL
jgi:repressor LexA